MAVQTGTKLKEKSLVFMKRIVNARKDYLDKISTEIVKNHDIIGMENLSVSVIC